MDQSGRALTISEHPTVIVSGSKQGEESGWVQEVCEGAGAGEGEVGRYGMVVCRRSEVGGTTV